LLVTGKCGYGSLMKAKCFPMAERDVLLDGFLPEYNRRLDLFYSEMVRFNVNVFIADAIVAFPFDLFGDGEGDLFFYAAATNSIEIALLLVYKLLRDNDLKSYSLVRFRNDIAVNVKDRAKLEYRKHLKENNVNPSTAKLLKKADSVRNNFIAHSSITANVNRSKINLLNLKDIHLIQAELNGMFRSLGFQKDFMFLPIPYEPTVIHPKGSDSRPDIVRVLDSKARESYILSMPEKHPEVWKFKRQHLKRNDVERLNEYRTRFGLPTV
jgi:hypothetical protein